MREASYTDELGRHHQVMLPDGVPDTDASMGVPVGPPSLTSLGLPIDTEVRLHNELFSRRIFTLAQAMKNRAEVVAAVRATLRIDAERLFAVYLESLTANTDNQNSPGPAVGRQRTRKG